MQEKHYIKGYTYKKYAWKMHGAIILQRDF